MPWDGPGRGPAEETGAAERNGPGRIDDSCFGLFYSKNQATRAKMQLLREVDMVLQH